MTLEALREQRRQLNHLEAELQTARADLKQTVRRAHEEGLRPILIREAAGISHQWLYELLKGD